MDAYDLVDGLKDFLDTNFNTALTTAELPNVKEIVLGYLDELKYPYNCLFVYLDDVSYEVETNSSDKVTAQIKLYTRISGVTELSKNIYKMTECLRTLLYTNALEALQVRTIFIKRAEYFEGTSELEKTASRVSTLSLEITFRQAS